MAHQAPILPLKAWRPDWFSGTALVLGSIAPDLEYLASFKPRVTGFGHSLEGQFLFCLPITFGITLYIGRLRIGETLASRLGWPLLSGAATDTIGTHGFFKIIVSALAGSFSHLMLDAMTHRLAPKWFKSFGVVQWNGLKLDPASLAQLVCSAVFAIVTLVVLRAMIKTAPVAPRARSDGRTLLMLGALAGAIVGGWRARPAFKNPQLYFYAAHLYVWGYALFQVACFIALAWLVIGGILAWRDTTQKAHRLNPEGP